MLAAALLCGEIARRAKLPAVIGELFGGILLGPTILGRLAPGVELWLFPAGGTTASARAIVAKIGVIAFLFVAGLEINLHDVRRNSRAVAMTSLGGILLPFAIAEVAVRLAPGMWLLLYSPASLTSIRANGSLPASRLLSAAGVIVVAMMTTSAR